MQMNELPFGQRVSFVLRRRFPFSQPHHYLDSKTGLGTEVQAPGLLEVQAQTGVPGIKITVQGSVSPAPHAPGRHVNPQRQL